MSSTMVLERGLFFGAAGASAVSPSPAGFTAGAPAAGWCVVPRCTMKIEKCTGGFKIHCHCEDDVACHTLHHLCDALAGGLCSCCCTLNGLCVCQCNLTCGICKCENTKDGCTITCTSGDKSCCAILQSCCATLQCCLEQGCCCYVCFNNTPCCCGTC
jgi:hypothetical protein